MSVSVAVRLASASAASFVNVLVSQHIQGDEQDTYLKLVEGTVI